MSQDKFYDWVIDKFNNDAYTMMDYFEADIDKAGAERSIDWAKTRDNVSLNGTTVKGKRVYGMCDADKGRVSVTAFGNTESTKHGNVVNYPTLRFNNFRSEFDGPVYFAGYKALWDEFKRHNEGKATNVPKVDAKVREERHRRIIEEERRAAKLEAEAIERDWSWLQKMARRSEPCPYLTRKGLGDAHTLFELYVGQTSKGMFTGEFTAVRSNDLRNKGAFGGLQRLYPNGKVFRTGLNPQGKAWFSKMPKDGQDIYLTEAVADAGMAAKLSNQCGCAAFYADNIAEVARLLRDMFPRSKIIFIADNDQYGEKNKGVECCVAATNAIKDNFEFIVPVFQSEEKAKKYKDLTDYCKAYGLEAGRQLITNHLRR